MHIANLLTSSVTPLIKWFFKFKYSWLIYYSKSDCAIRVFRSKTPIMNIPCGKASRWWHKTAYQVSFSWLTLKYYDGKLQDKMLKAHNSKEDVLVTNSNKRSKSHSYCSCYLNFMQSTNHRCRAIQTPSPSPWGQPAVIRWVANFKVIWTTHISLTSYTKQQL